MQRNQAAFITSAIAAAALAGLVVLAAFFSAPAMAQYDAWPASRLLTEHRRMLENMDGVIKALDANIALADTLKQEKQELDRVTADIETRRQALEADGNTHNAEAERFTNECLQETLTDPAQGARCNDWSARLNARSEELTARRKDFNAMVERHNTQVESFNQREQARAREAADLDRRYDEYERNAARIEARLSSLEETSDIAARCATYKEAETRQRCMQKIYDDEN